jgi:hypothetical protein
MAKDLRPVFPQERLLLEILLGKKPHEFIEQSVWAADSRYYINGKAIMLASKLFQEADADAISQQLSLHKEDDTNPFFENHISTFIKANSGRLHYLKDEANDFIHKAVQGFDEDHIVLSFSGGKDSTATADVVIKALGNTSLVHIFGNTTLEFPLTYEYAERNGKLTKLTYGNGDYEQYVYDRLDRLVKVVYNGNASSGYELFYDANGNETLNYKYSLGILQNSAKDFALTGDIFSYVPTVTTPYGFAVDVYLYAINEGTCKQVLKYSLSNGYVNNKGFTYQKKASEDLRAILVLRNLTDNAKPEFTFNVNVTDSGISTNSLIC